MQWIIGLWKLATFLGLSECNKKSLWKTLFSVINYYILASFHMKYGKLISYSKYQKNSIYEEKICKFCHIILTEKLIGDSEFLFLSHCVVRACYKCPFWLFVNKIESDTDNRKTIHMGTKLLHIFIHSNWFHEILH